MPDEPIIPPSDEVLDEHAARGSTCSPDCVSCRLRALVHEVQAMNPRIQLLFGQLMVVGGVEMIDEVMRRRAAGGGESA